MEYSEHRASLSCRERLRGLEASVWLIKPSRDDDSVSTLFVKTYKDVCRCLLEMYIYFRA